MAQSDWGPYAKQIWDFLVAEYGNEYGVAGLMGNLWGESSLTPNRIQGEYGFPTPRSDAYTARVDSGELSRADFIYRGPNGNGYGLAQWTADTRKAGLYDRAKQKGVSIGDLRLALDYLVEELDYRVYSTVKNSIINATSVTDPCNKVLEIYEAPGDIPGTRPYRQRYSQAIYNDFHGTEPGPTPGPVPTVSKTMPLWMYIKPFYKR